MTRGQFLVSLGAGARLLRGTDRPAVDAARLRCDLESLSVFGRPPGGTFADGVSRVAFSDADVAGRTFIVKRIEEAGLSPWIDAAGNIFARRTGGDERAAPVLFGSHIDSVPNGGNFDGDLGVLASLEAIRVLNDAQIQTRRPLEIVVWSNEEGVAFNNGLFGSRAVAGRISDDEMEQVWNGVKKSDAVRKIGGAPENIARAQRPSGWFHAYLELHIEQGGKLDRAQIPIGVVEGIVAIDRFAVEVRGFANHAGTTAMEDRQDALLAASRLALAVNETVRAEAGAQVGTVGHLEVHPNAPNVVPGLVRMTIELRDLSEAKIARLAEKIQERARAIASATRTAIDIRKVSHHEAAAASSAIQEAIAAAADRAGFRWQRMPSGAGHDAQMMARLGPMGMIFVPSVGGISHSPRELTSWEDCARGAQILLDTVLRLAA
jgi:N-carbamoyl-L-amino-acid hydrolase